MKESFYNLSRYDGDKITIREGINENPTVLAITDLDIYILTTLEDIST
jgi:hypothetical protein